MMATLRISLGAAFLAALTIVPVTPANAVTTCADIITIGHRGNGQGANENTIPHMRRAAANGAEVSEFDVRSTRNGGEVIMHDSTVGRMTNGTGEVSRMTTARFLSLRVRPSGVHPPTYQMMVREAARLGIGMQIHLKFAPGDARLRNMAAYATQYGFTADNTQFNSDNMRVLQRVERVSDFPTGYTYLGRPSQSRLNTVSNRGIDIAVLDQDYISPRWVRYARERGVELGARDRSISTSWAINNDVRRLVVDRVTQRC